MAIVCQHYHPPRHPDECDICRDEAREERKEYLLKIMFPYEEGNQIERMDAFLELYGLLYKERTE